jgi:DNA-binding NarL/FixJ family response regulator
VRALLREILGAEADMSIVAEAADIDEAIELTRSEVPDVVLVDPEHPVPLVVPELQRLKRECPGAQLVLVGRRGSDDDLFACLQAGVAAQLRDDARPPEIVATIRSAAAGEYLIDRAVAARPEVARRVLDAFRDSSLLGEVAAGDLASTAFAPLSAREAEILEAIADGLTNRAIGERFSISEATVKSHVTSILRKLAVNGRTQAVLYALKRSWIALGDEQLPRQH